MRFGAWADPRRYDELASYGTPSKVGRALISGNPVLWPSRDRQYPIPRVRDGHRVLEVRRPRSIHRHDRPFVRERTRRRPTDVHHRLDRQRQPGYEFEAAEGSFDIIVKKVVGTYKPWFDRLAYRVNIEQGTSGPPVTEATVKLRLAGSIEHTVSEGDGPVNALDAALRKALIAYYPRLDEMLLVDYKVRVVNPKEGTAARVRVIIESRDHRSTWGTVGVSENLIEASWLALVDAIEYKLFRDEEPA